MSKIEVNAIEPQCGTNLTVGASGDTITFPSGTTVVNNGSQTGFGRTGTVDWQTGSIKTATFTAANGEGYFANTSGGAFTMNLPAGTAGNIVSVVDYTNTFQTNSLTISPNGSQKIGGVNADFSATTEGQSLTFVYVDDTEGWKNVQDSTSNAVGNPFIVATGGTETTCGDFKIHTFTGPGTFTVSNLSSTPAENTVGYMVLAGGGAGGNNNAAGGGGGGGFREGRNVPIDNFTASPLVANAPTNAVTITTQAYPITVGAGGAAAYNGNPGSNSVFSTITSAGGGGGSGGDAAGTSGGSGGGAGGGGGPGGPTLIYAGGTGNTPPVSPSQGNDGGDSPRTPDAVGDGGGGGGATTAGGDSTNGPGPARPSIVAGDGGNGATTSITASPVAYAGGGGGGGAGNAGSGGSGGGGAGGQGFPANGTSGTTNRGGGGGGSADGTAGAGGSGVVVIRYKFQ